MLILALGGLAFVYLKMTAPAPAEITAEERSWRVTSMPVELSAQKVGLVLLGSFSPIGFSGSNDSEKMLVKNVSTTMTRSMVELAINKDRRSDKLALEEDARLVERTLRALRNERREIENDDYLSRERKDALVKETEAYYKAEIDWFNRAYDELMRGDN